MAEEKQQNEMNLFGRGIWNRIKAQPGARQKKRELMLHMGGDTSILYAGIRLPLWREVGELVSQFESLDDGVFRILE